MRITVILTFQKRKSDAVYTKKIFFARRFKYSYSNTIIASKSNRGY